MKQLKLSVRKTALRDLSWYRYYHTNRVADVRGSADRKLRATFDLLKANPYAGKLWGEGQVRSFPVLRTVFVLLYLVVGDTVQVIRIWDSRADPELLGDLSKIQ